MKKTIALVLAVILLISIIGTALAAHTHNWHLVSTTDKIQRTTLPRQNGCIKLSVPHVHWIYHTITTKTYLCFTCGQIKQIKTTSVKERCPANN